jgi:hypothetical protein
MRTRDNARALHLHQESGSRPPAPASARGATCAVAPRGLAHSRYLFYFYTRRRAASIDQHRQAAACGVAVAVHVRLQKAQVTSYPLTHWATGSFAC